MGGDEKEREGGTPISTRMCHGKQLNFFLMECQDQHPYGNFLVGGGGFTH